MRKKTIATIFSMITILLIFLSISFAATPTEWVEAHNKYRRMHLAPPVVWNDTLAQEALACANTVHGKKGPNKNSNHCNYGENYHSSKTDSAETIVGDWYNNPPWREEENYTKLVGYGNEPEVKIIDGKKKIVDLDKFGHFTQVVWNNTREIGCATGAHGTVCNYFPYGNYQNQFAANVKPKMPQVDIKVNGLDNVTVSSNTPVSIAFSLDTHGWAGVYSDWWFIIGTPWGIYSFKWPTMDWVFGLEPLTKYNLFDISPPWVIFNGILGLPKGTYVILIGVDNPDGILNLQNLCYDLATITIQ
jgi:hypothetical protein